MDPITIVLLVISIASGIAMTISASIIIIKNGKDITDNIEEFFRSIGKKDITINKASAYPAFAGVCKFFAENKKQIKCKKWALTMLPDKDGKQKSFSLPAPGRYIEIELKTTNKVLIHVMADNKASDNPNIGGFVIYYKNHTQLKEFATTALKKFMSDEDLKLFTEEEELINIPNDKMSDDDQLIVQQAVKSTDDIVDQVATQIHHADMQIHAQ